MEAIINYIRPELLVLVPVLYFIGLGLKKAQGVPDRFIPLLLGAAGVLLAIIYVLASSPVAGWQECLMALFVALTQGVLCAGASVYLNQVAKQAGKDKEGMDVEHYQD